MTLIGFRKACQRGWTSSTACLLKFKTVVVEMRLLDLQRPDLNPPNCRKGPNAPSKLWSLIRLILSISCL